MSPVRDQLSLPPAEVSQQRLHVLDDILKAPSPHPALHLLVRSRARAAFVIYALQNSLA
jgi:hypothetical protein